MRNKLIVKLENDGYYLEVNKRGEVVLKNENNKRKIVFGSYWDALKAYIRQVKTDELRTTAKRTHYKLTETELKYRLKQNDALYWDWMLRMNEKLEVVDKALLDDEGLWNTLPEEPSTKYAIR